MPDEVDELILKMQQPRGRKRAPQREGGRRLEGRGKSLKSTRAADRLGCPVRAGRGRGAAAHRGGEAAGAGRAIPGLKPIAAARTSSRRGRRLAEDAPYPPDQGPREAETSPSTRWRKRSAREYEGRCGPRPRARKRTGRWRRIRLFKGTAPTPDPDPDPRPRPRPRPRTATPTSTPDADFPTRRPPRPRKTLAARRPKGNLGFGCPLRAPRCASPPGPRRSWSCGSWAPSCPSCTGSRWAAGKAAGRRRGRRAAVGRRHVTSRRSCSRPIIPLILASGWLFGPWGKSRCRSAAAVASARTIRSAAARGLGAQRVLPGGCFGPAPPRAGPRRPSPRKAGWPPSPLIRILSPCSPFTSQQRPCSGPHRSQDAAHRPRHSARHGSRGSRL